MLGARNFVEVCKRMAVSAGPRFEPCSLLIEMAKKIPASEISRDSIVNDDLSANEPTDAVAEVRTSSGPLAGLRVLELAGIGPGPYAGMLLGDLGAEVIRIERRGAESAGNTDPTLRNRRNMTLDLKSQAAVDVVLRLIERSDVLLEDSDLV